MTKQPSSIGASRSPESGFFPDTQRLGFHDAKLADQRINRDSRRPNLFKNVPPEKLGAYLTMTVPLLLTRLMPAAGDLPFVTDHSAFGGDHDFDHSPVISVHDAAVNGLAEIAGRGQDAICASDKGPDLLVKAWEMGNVLVPALATKNPELVAAAKAMGIDRYEIKSIVEKGASELAKREAKKVMESGGSPLEACWRILAIANHYYPTKDGWLHIGWQKTGKQETMVTQLVALGEEGRFLKKKPLLAGFINGITDGAKQKAWSAPALPAEQTPTPTTVSPWATSTVEVPNPSGQYEFIDQAAIVAEFGALYERWQTDPKLQALFADPSTVEYSAVGLNVFSEGGQSHKYAFFGAKSEAEGKGRIAMVLVRPKLDGSGRQVFEENKPVSEVGYSVLNRIVDANGYVYLALTQDAYTGDDLPFPVMIFNTGLTEQQIAGMTIEELESRMMIFVLGGVEVPVDQFLTGLKVQAAPVPVEFTPTPSLPPLIAEYVSTHPDATDYTVNVDADGATHLNFAPEAQWTKEQLVTAINKECAAARACVGFSEKGNAFFNGVWSGDVEIVITLDGRLQVFAGAFTNHDGLEKVRMLVLPDWPKNGGINIIAANLGIPENPSVADLLAVFAHGQPAHVIFDATNSGSEFELKYTVPLGFGEEYIRQITRWINGQMTPEEVDQFLFFVIG